MAARSEGIFPREGFNLDNAFEVTETPVAPPVSLTHCRTIRIVIVGLVETAPTGDYTAASLSYTIGEEIYGVDLAKVDPNGVYIEHRRGHGIAAGDVSYSVSTSTGTTGTPGDITVGGMFIELVDGVAR